MQTKWTVKFNSLNTLALLAAGGLASEIGASTFVSGNVSGTWATNGNPYVATGNLVVPSGQTLTMQPGVTLIIGQGLNVDAEGSISAVGTPALPITIRGANSSLYWDSIYINYRGTQSSFANCIISEATNALYLLIDGSVAGSGVMKTSIRNCIFTNIQNVCIYGRSHGVAGNAMSGPYTYFPILRPSIICCIFANSTNGCSFLSDGMHYNNAGASWEERGAVNPQILNCNFVSITGTALRVKS